MRMNVVVDFAENIVESLWLGGRRELSVTGNGFEEEVALVTIRRPLYPFPCGPYYVLSASLFTATDGRTRVDSVQASLSALMLCDLVSISDRPSRVLCTLPLCVLCAPGLLLPRTHCVKLGHLPARQKFSGPLLICTIRHKSALRK